MEKFKIYLDNCCFNRPFDDISQILVKNEAIAKMFIQSLIKYKCIILYSSYMLVLEINENPFAINRDHIFNFVNDYSEVFISKEREREIIPLTNIIMESGIKLKDAVHIACSIVAECDYFITTDKRLLKYATDKIYIVDPIKFVEIWRSQND